MSTSTTKTSPPTGQGSKEPPALRHAKLLLFWGEGWHRGTVVGSHNWTKRAILGLNVEASLVVRLKDTSPLFAAASDYLAHMKAVAEPFDVAKVDFYKALQRKMLSGLTPVIELKAEDGASASNTTITVFGTDRKDLTRLGTVRREVHVALLDPQTDAQSVYPATILHSGLLPASYAAAGGISFSPRRYAYRKGRQCPALRRSGPVDPEVLTAAEYFVTVRLGALRPQLVVTARPTKTPELRRQERRGRGSGAGSGGRGKRTQRTADARHAPVPLQRLYWPLS